MVEVREDSLIFFLLMSTILLLLMLGFFFAFIQLYRRKQLLFKTAQKEREQEFSKELMRSQLEIREQVMHQISEELHDNIGQSLIVAKMQLGMIDREQFPEQIDAADELLSRSLQDLRSISKTLNGDYILREGIDAALKNEGKLINASQQVRCETEGSFNGAGFSPNVEIIVFRCIQEILSNAIKHSKADKINIRLSDQKERIEIEISDNGNGLPENMDKNEGLGLANLIEISDNGKGMPEDRNQTDGLGLNNLTRRVALIGGNLIVNSKNGSGTKISINLPRNQPTSL